MIKMQFSFKTDVERAFVRRIIDGIGCVTRLTHPMQRSKYWIIYADAEIPEHLKGGMLNAGDDSGPEA